MTTVIQNRFDGGHAEDIRTFATNECEYSKNFDIFSKSHLLQPYPDTVTEVVAAGTITDHKMSDIIDTVTLSGDGFIALGQAGSADANLKFFSKSNITSDWTKRAEQTAGSVVNNTLVGYKGLAFAIESSGSDLNLLELTDATTITDQGTITGVTTACKPFVHPEDQLLYIGADYKIARYDGTNDIDSGTGSSYIMTSLLPTNAVITSLTHYGTYLAIAVRNLNGNGIAYLWGRDTTLNTTQGIIDFGRGNLNTLENLGDVLVGIVSPNVVTTDNDRVQVKIWSGGEVITIKEIDVSFTGNANSILKAKSNGKLYFTIGNSDCIYVVGKNKDGKWVVSKDRYVANGSTPSSVRGLSILDDYMWIGYNNGVNDVFYRTGDTYTSTSTYRTTINTSIPTADRYKDKQLDATQLSYTGASSGTTVLKYGVDGSSMTTIISDTNATGEQVIEASAENTNNLALLAGREIQFQIESTGGSKIKELKYKYTPLNSLL